MYGITTTGRLVELTDSEMGMISVVEYLVKEWWETGELNPPTRCFLNNDDFNISNNTEVLGIKCYSSRLVPKGHAVLAIDYPVLRF